MTVCVLDLSVDNTKPDVEQRFQTSLAYQWMIQLKQMLEEWYPIIKHVVEVNNDDANTLFCLDIYNNDSDTINWGRPF